MADKNVKKEEKPKMVGREEQKVKLLKAKKASKAASKGKHTIRKFKVHNDVTFRRPKTQGGIMKKVVARVSSVKYNNFDDYAIIKHPVASETAMKQIESNNTLTFIVDVKANKRQIKKACERLYKIKVRGVNTLIRPDGLKKAYVKVSKDQEALDVANKIGFM